MTNRTGVEDFPYFYAPNAHDKLTMPVEFSVAAYRVGHTMVRSVYAVNGQNLDVELFDERFATLGFSNYPEELVVDWRYLLPVDDCLRPRMSKAIDPLLAGELQDMPVVNSNNPNNRDLAFRENLLRGNAMSLPSGQAVAGQLQSKGYRVDPNLFSDGIWETGSSSSSSSRSCGCKPLSASTSRGLDGISSPPAS